MYSAPTQMKLIFRTKFYLFIVFEDKQFDYLEDKSKLMYFFLSYRDAVAKALYQRLFTWLVEKINAIVKGPEPADISNQRDKVVSIAILDIFGFEVSLHLIV